MTSNIEQFAYNMSSISLYWHRVASSVMKRYGLKGSTAIYFIRLNQYPDGITAKDLGNVCGKDKADVSREIAILERAGLVTRASEGKRGYRVPIILTESGKELAEKISGKAILAAEIVSKALSDEEREVFRKAFDSISENFRILSEEGLPED